MKYLNGFFSEMFKVLLPCYFFLFVVELIKVGTVSIYFDLNYILAAVIISGIIKVITNFPNNSTSLKTSIPVIKPEIYIYLGLITNIVLFLFLKDLSIFGLIISFLVSIIFVLILFLTQHDNL